MNQNSYQEEVEIDLIQFCKRLLVQWRAIVAVALIFGLLVMALKYVKDDRAYRVSVADKNAEVEDLEASLTDAEKDAVYLAIDTQKQIDAKKKYLKDSVYMNLNPEDYKIASVLYMIETDGATDAYDVSYLYREYLSADRVAPILKKELNLDLDENYVRELYSISSSHTDNEKRQKDFVEVSFIVPDGVSEETAVAALKNVVENCDDVKDKLSYTISLETETLSEASESEKNDLQDAQASARSALISLETSQNEKVNAFTGEQKELYNGLLTKYTDSESFDALKEDEGAEEVFAASFSGKYFVIGLFAGIVLYAGLFFVYIVLNPRAVELAVAGVSAMPCLGLLKDKASTKKGILPFLTCDPLVYNLLYKEQDEHLSKPENILGQMKVYAGGEETTRFCVLQPGFDLTASETMQVLKEKANAMELDITVVPVNVSDVSDIVSKLDAEVPTVVSIYESKTKRKDIYALYEILKNQKVKVLGELYVR